MLSYLCRKVDPYFRGNTAPAILSLSLSPFGEEEDAKIDRATHVTEWNTRETRAMIACKHRWHNYYGTL